MPTYRKIHSKGLYWRGEERVAAGTITPGMLTEEIAAGTVQAHSTEGGRSEKMIALEDALQGNTVTDDYSALDQVFLALAMPGDEFIMQVASGETLTIGEQLISAGDGTLKARDNASSGVTVQETIAYAQEAITTTAITLVKVRIK